MNGVVRKFNADCCSINEALMTREGEMLSAENRLKIIPTTVRKRLTKEHVEGAVPILIGVRIGRSFLGSAKTK